MLRCWSSSLKPSTVNPDGVSVLPQRDVHRRLLPAVGHVALVRRCRGLVLLERRHNMRHCRSPRRVRVLGRGVLRAVTGGGGLEGDDRKSGPPSLGRRGMRRGGTTLGIELARGSAASRPGSTWGRRRGMIEGRWRHPARLKGSRVGAFPWGSRRLVRSSYVGLLGQRRNEQSGGCIAYCPDIRSGAISRDFSPVEVE